jgi:two-component system, NtrC family, sensor kinase
MAGLGRRELGGAADLERELAESRAREAALAEVLGVMRRAPGELATVLDAVLDRAASLCGAERASIHLLDGDVYRTAAFWGPRNPEYERVAYDTTRKPGRETLIGRTALDRAVVHIPDVLTDPEYTAKDLQRLAGYRTMLGVPLFRGEAVAGVFVLTRNEVRAFSDREIALVRAFADQAVVAVENARLLKGTNDALERQTAISEVLKEMSQSVFDLERVLESVAMNAVRLCAADNGSIAQLKSDGWRLVANVGDIDQESMERNWANQPIEADRRSLTGRVLMDRRTTTIVDAQADPEYDAGVGLFKVRSMIGVPLTRGEDIVGVLILRRQEPKPFTPEQIHLLETFADQASIAIENVRLFDETKEALEQQTATSEILRVIAGSPAEVQPVLDAIAENAARVCGASDAHVYRVEDEVLKQWAHFGPIPGLAPDESLPLSRGSLIGRCILDRRAIHTEDAAALDPDEYPISVQLQRRWGYRTALSVPLIRDGVGIGGIAIRRVDVHPFTPKQIELLETFADQAVIAIENARLFNKTKEALERQTAIGDVLRTIGSAAFDLELVLEEVAKHAARLCQAENVVIFRTLGNTYRLAAGPVPPNPDFARIVGANPQTIGLDTIVGRAHLEARPIQVADTIEYYRDAKGSAAELARVSKIRTLLAVPLIRDGVVLGVISLTRSEVRPFSAEAVDLVRTFADQAAIAIANVELFQTVKRQREELSRFLSPQVAKLVTSEDGAKLLEGHRRQITVVFCDLRNFTAFAESAEPEEVLGVLRDYHRAMGELIVKHQGTLEHFAGDGMMVFFNDPLPVERHELQAVRMACAMRESFDGMARMWQKRGYELGFGVGIATGYATLGRIGFEGRYDYGAIGNVVILAQRLSAEAKAGQILLSQRVQAAVETDADTTAVGDLTLKGFTRPIPAFAAESVKTPTPARS